MSRLILLQLTGHQSYARRLAEAFLRVAAAAVVSSSLLLGGCSSHSKPPRGAAHVEMLRLRISKVRHAIQQTRETIALSQGAETLPELYLRLAELQSEEASYHFRVTQERQAGATALHVPQVRLLKENAIATYRRLLRDFPDTHLAPRVLFNIAHELRELGDYDEARPTLRRLIDEYPESPLRNEALLVLGDYHFDKSELEESKTHYQLITEGPQTRLTGLAHYKLAWVWVNQNDCKNALEEFEAALDAEQAWAELTEKPWEPLPKRRRKRAKRQGGQTADDSREPRAETTQEGTAETGGEMERAAADGAESEAVRANDDSEDHRALDVRRSALVDLAYCYGQERTPDGALAFLREYAHDRATYIAGMSRMARRFEIAGGGEGNLPLLRELLRLGPADEDRLEDARRLHTAIRATKKYDNVGQDVRAMTGVLERRLGRLDTTSSKRAKLTEEFELYARDLLTRAQGKLDDRGDDQRAAAVDLANGYRAYLAAFPSANHRTAMLENLSAVLATAGRNFEAGNHAFQAARSTAPGRERLRLLLNAVAHYQGSLATGALPEDKRNSMVARAALRRSGREVLRYPTTEENQRRVKFAIAESYYHEGLYREAIDHLTAVAYEYPQTSEATAAIRLVLDSHNTLNDFGGLVAAGNLFLEGNSPATTELRAELAPIVKAAELRRVDAVSLGAAGDEGGHQLKELLTFARANRGTKLGEHALVNALLVARAEGDVEEIYRLGDEIRKHHPKAEQLPAILATLGQTAVARFEMERALSFLNKAAEAGHPQSVQLLIAVGEILEQLGDAEGAKRSYVAAITKAKERGRFEPQTRLAMLLERQGDWQATASGLVPYAEEGNAEVLARLGLALLTQGDRDAAEMRFRQVLGGSSASQAAMARSHYGAAEAVTGILDGYPKLEGATFVEEYLDLVSIAQQDYLAAVQQGDPEYTPLALARWTRMLRRAATKLDAVELQGDQLAPEDSELLENAIQARATEMRATAKKAEATCKEQAWVLQSFHSAGRQCADGKLPEEIVVEFDKLEKHGPFKSPGRVRRVLDKLALDAEDVEALRALGEAYERAGDFHVARMVYAATAERSQAPGDINRLGIVTYRVGDRASAIGSFLSAAEGGLEAGRQNAAKVLGKMGLNSAAKTVLKRFPKGRSGGEML